MLAATAIRTAIRTGLSLLACELLTYAAYRPACHLRVMMRPSASISLNHGMPGKTKPGRSDGFDISALQIPPTWEEGSSSTLACLDHFFQLMQFGFRALLSGRL